MTAREILEQRARLFQQLAELDLDLAAALEDDRPQAPDLVLSLEQAAALMGEPASTFRRRPEYLKALVSRPGERRLRYSRAALQAIKADRLAGSAVR